MMVEEEQYRRLKVAVVRRLVESGEYDRAWDEILCCIANPEPPAKRNFWQDLDLIPEGSSHWRQYQIKASELLASCLGEVIDFDRLRSEHEFAGRRMDLEMFLRSERLWQFPLWEHWAQRFDMRSIMVEVKNWKRPVPPSAVAQLADYLNSANRGRFGMLVARNGVSTGARKSLCEKAQQGNQLIVALDHHDLAELQLAANHSRQAVMDFLGGKERELLSAA